MAKADIQSNGRIAVVQQFLFDNETALNRIPGIEIVRKNVYDENGDIVKRGIGGKNGEIDDILGKGTASTVQSILIAAGIDDREYDEAAQKKLIEFLENNGMDAEQAGQFAKDVNNIINDKELGPLYRAYAKADVAAIIKANEEAEPEPVREPSFVPTLIAESELELKSVPAPKFGPEQKSVIETPPPSAEEEPAPNPEEETPPPVEKETPPVEPEKKIETNPGKTMIAEGETEEPPKETIRKSAAQEYGIEGELCSTSHVSTMVSGELMACHERAVENTGETLEKKPETEQSTPFLADLSKTFSFACAGCHDSSLAPATAMAAIPPSSVNTARQRYNEIIGEIDGLHSQQTEVLVGQAKLLDDTERLADYLDITRSEMADKQFEITIHSDKTSRKMEFSLKELREMQAKGLYNDEDNPVKFRIRGRGYDDTEYTIDQLEEIRDAIAQKEYGTTDISYDQEDELNNMEIKFEVSCEAGDHKIYLSRNQLNDDDIRGKYQNMPWYHRGIKDDIIEAGEARFQEKLQAHEGYSALVAEYRESVNRLFGNAEDAGFSKYRKNIDKFLESNDPTRVANYGQDATIIRGFADHFECLRDLYGEEPTSCSVSEIVASLFIGHARSDNFIGRATGVDSAYIEDGSENLNRLIPGGKFEEQYIALNDQAETLLAEAKQIENEVGKTALAATEPETESDTATLAQSGASTSTMKPVS